jgi:hypothetical protein
MICKNLIFVGIASIPGREESLLETLDSILKNTILPDKIYITITKKYKNYGVYNTSCLEKYKENKLIEIIMLDEDLGPCSKLLGPLTKIESYEGSRFILLLDDDHIYKDYMIETFHQEIIDDENICCSYYVYTVKGVPIGQGADGFLIKLGLIKHFKEYYNFLMDNTDLWFYQDDLLISSFLHNKNIKIKNLRKKLRGQDPFIYSFGSGHYVHGLNRLTGNLSRRNLNEFLVDSFLNFFPDSLKKFR